MKAFSYIAYLKPCDDDYVIWFWERYEATALQAREALLSRTYRWTH